VTYVKQPAHVRLARYGMVDLGRAHGLSSAERLVLFTLVLSADYKTWRWNGYLTTLAEDAGASRNTVAGVLDRLADRGLVKIDEPFQRGKPGGVAILVYGELVVDATKPSEVAQYCATDGEGGRADVAQTSRSRRAVVAQNRATSPPVTRHDAAPLREQERQVRNEGNGGCATVPPRAVEPIEVKKCGDSDSEISQGVGCVSCGDPVSPHSEKYCGLCERF